MEMPPCWTRQEEKKADQEIGKTNTRPRSLANVESKLTNNVCQSIPFPLRSVFPSRIQIFARPLGLSLIGRNAWNMNGPINAQTSTSVFSLRWCIWPVWTRGWAWRRLWWPPPWTRPTPWAGPRLTARSRREKWPTYSSSTPQGTFAL